MRVATWNLWHRFGDWERRAPAILSVLAEVDADVVCLQEVWTEDAGRTQAGELAAALGMSAFVDAHRVGHEGVTFGNAILSRWPLRRHEVRPLPPHPDYEEFRTVLGVEVASPDGAAQVFTTHLNFANHHSAVRQGQVRAVAAMVLDWGRGGRVQAPVICGDFNASPRAEEIRMLTGDADLGLPIAFIDAWAAAGRTAAGPPRVGPDGRSEDPGHTWCRRNPMTRASYEPDRRIDYVFVGYPRDTDGRGEVVQCRRFGDDPVDGTWPSDHFGVVVDLAS